MCQDPSGAIPHRNRRMLPGPLPTRLGDGQSRHPPARHNAWQFSRDRTRYRHDGLLRHRLSYTMWSHGQKTTGEPCRLWTHTGQPDDIVMEHGDNAVAYRVDETREKLFLSIYPKRNHAVRARPARPGVLTGAGGDRCPVAPHGHDPEQPVVRPSPARDADQARILRDSGVTQAPPSMLTGSGRP